MLRLKPGASLILACNHYAYASQPLLLAAWGERWRMQEANPDEVEAKLAKICKGRTRPSPRRLSRCTSRKEASMPQSALLQPVLGRLARAMPLKRDA